CVVLFELLTGRHPFASGQERAAAPPRRICPEVPEVLDRVVRRCLEPQPERRYQTAAELAQALDGSRELCRAMKEMPPAGPLTRAALRHPAVWGGILSLLPHVIGAGVDLGYNALWLSALPAGADLLAPFVLLALSYTAIAFLVTGWLASWL